MANAQQRRHPAIVALSGHYTTGHKGKLTTFRDINGWYSHQSFESKPDKYDIMSLKKRPLCRLQKILKEQIGSSLEDIAMSGQFEFVQDIKTSTVLLTSK
jgi:hypothetical protein